MAYVSATADLLGLSTATFLVLLLWVIFWKGLALWHSARNSQTYWFIALLIINTAGILEIIYLVFFRKDRKKKTLFGKRKRKK